MRSRENPKTVELANCFEVGRAVISLHGLECQGHRILLAARDAKLRRDFPPASHGLS